MINEATKEALKASGKILILLVLAKTINILMAILLIPDQLMAVVSTLALNRYIILAVICIFYIILGCFMDVLTAIMMTTSIVLPVIISLGFDPIWFGIVLVLLDEMGMITPPFGISLFIVQGLRPNYLYEDILRGSLPIVAVIAVLLIIIIIFPTIVTFLPNLVTI